MSALFLSCLLLCSFQTVIEQEPSVQRTPVVFHYDGALFPGRRPLFGLQAEDGTIRWSEPGQAKSRINDSPEGMEMWWEIEDPNAGVIWGVPEGKHTFIVKSTPHDEILRIPDIEITALPGYGCYPDELQDIELIELDSIAVTFEDLDGEFMPLRGWKEDAILVMLERDGELIEMPNRIIENGRLRISNDYIRDHYWLIMNSYLPVPLQEWQCGDVIPLKRMQSVQVEFLPPDNWPEDAYVTVDIAPDSQSRTMPKVQAAQGCLRYDWDADHVELYFPDAGSYALTWNLMIGPYHLEIVSTMGGGIIQLPPPDLGVPMQLKVPSALAPVAKRELEVAKNAPTPVIEMQAAPPPPELPERPPR